MRCRFAVSLALQPQGFLSVDGPLFPVHSSYCRHGRAGSPACRHRQRLRVVTRTQQCRVPAPISALTALDGDPAWLLGSARACGATASLQVRLGALASTPCRASPRQTAAGPALRNRLTADSAICMRMHIDAESSPAKCQALSAAQFCVGVRGKRGVREIRGVRSECGLASARQTPHLLTRRA